MVKRERALGAVKVGKVILYKGIDMCKYPNIIMKPGLVDIGELIGEVGKVDWKGSKGEGLRYLAEGFKCFLGVNHHRF